MSGHAFDTWRHRETNSMWLRDFLPEQVQNARILIYGYDANVVVDTSTGRIRTFAEALLEGLRTLRNTDAVSRVC